MTRLDKRVQALAVCLSGVAGYVDAVGFLHSGGFFVSFMSGNSTRLAVGLAHWTTAAAIAGGLIGSFVIGVTLGSLCGSLNERHRRSIVLVLVAVVLAGAAALGTAGSTWRALALTALAMGAENAAFEQPGGGSIGLTYMTGTLAKIGQGIAAMLRRRGGFEWLSYVALWAGLVAGAILGAAVYAQIAMAALWFAAGASAILAIVARRLHVG
ncbi:YoaK family protein [Sphingomonas psychrolutea]|uniref:YoaK family protein n=1 Tax=Sphingomonas psychrolutea TaxID=1259676 RepID=UPI0016694C49|nr:YoaK family protein [Sphingomonas psychrolutea]